MSLKMKQIFIKIILVVLILTGILIIYEQKRETIAIVGAMDCEIAEISALLKNIKVDNKNDFYIKKGRLWKYNIILSKTGIGKVNATATVQYIIDKYNPKYIITTGLAGSLDSNVKMGDIVIAKECAQHDFDNSVFGYAKGYLYYGEDKSKFSRFPSNKKLIEFFKKSLSDKNPNVYTGLIVSGDTFISDNKKKIELREEFNPIAVDMESCAIIQTALKNNIPAVVIKTISDNVLDGAEEYQNNEEKIAKISAHNIIIALQNNQL